MGAPLPPIATLADRAFRAGLKMPDVLRRAEVPMSTWRRWAQGGNYTSTTLAKLEKALGELIEEHHG